MTQPDVAPDPTWNLDPADLHLVSDDDIARMTDAQQLAFLHALNARQAALSALLKHLRFKLSPPARYQVGRARAESVELYNRLGSLRYDQGRRAGRFDKTLGRHPLAWPR